MRLTEGVFPGHSVYHLVVYIIVIYLNPYINVIIILLFCYCFGSSGFT